MNTPPPINIASSLTYKATSKDDQDTKRDVKDIVKNDIAAVPMLTRNQQRMKAGNAKDTNQQGLSTMTTYLIGMTAPTYILNPLAEKFLFNNKENVAQNKISQIMKWFDRYSPQFDAKYKPFFEKCSRKIDQFFTKHMHPDNLNLFKTGFNEGWMFTAKRENLLERKIKAREQVLKKLEHLASPTDQTGLGVLEKAFPSFFTKRYQAQETKLSQKISSNTELILTHRKNLEEAHRKVGNTAPGRTSFPSLIGDLREKEKNLFNALDAKYPLIQKHYPDLAKKMADFVDKEGHADIAKIETFFKKYPHITDFRGDKVSTDFLSRIMRRKSSLLSTFEKVKTQNRVLKTFENGLKLGTAGKMSARVLMTIKRNMTGLMGLMQGVFVASSIADLVHSRKGEKFKFAMEDVFGNWLIGFGSFFLMDWIGKGIIKIGKGETQLINLLKGTGITRHTTATKNAVAPAVAHKGVLQKFAKALLKIRASHVIFPMLGSFAITTLGVKGVHLIFGKPISDDELKEDKINGFLDEIGVKQK